MPAPQRLETVKEPYILEQIGEQPKTGWHRKHRETEQDKTEDRHGEEKTQQAHHAHTEVPHSLAEHDRPQREEYDGEDTRHHGRRHGLLLPLRTLVQPYVMHHGVGFLVLFDLDRPQALDAILRLGVVMARVGIHFAHAQGEEREGK